MKPLKTCVYAIALNEIKHVDLFMQHCQGADLVLVCDTGSTDGTPERLEQLGATVYRITQRPWRFDTPRNTALSLVPADIDFCLSIDLDEYLQPGWDQAMRDAWDRHNGEIDRISYDYIWNWSTDTTPGTRFFADKMHHRRGYIWHHPCHETLYLWDDHPERRVTVPEIILHHRADPTKSRGQYIGLLAKAVREDPSNDRMAHYYGRELMFQRRYDEAIAELTRHLELPSCWWREERCASMRFIARSYAAKNNQDEARVWAQKAVMECPWTREPWLDMARVYRNVRDWHTVFYAIGKLLEITVRGTTYINDADCWGFEPYDLGAMAAWYLGLREKSLELGQKALEFHPDDARLNNNLLWYQGKVM
jgi:glycosyltransferase involved in cell wall biosynthesis